MNKTRTVVVYDLNKTLYNKSSKDEFFKYVCFKKGYKLINLIQIAALKTLDTLKLIDVTTFKENFFNYLKNIEPKRVERYADEFWSIEFDRHFNKKLLKSVEKHKEAGNEVIIITGGLEIYTKPLLKYLEIDALLGTITKYKDGKYEIVGEACKDEEKIKRLQEYMGNQDFHLIEAYSDDKEPILDLADKAFYVKDGKVMPHKKTDK